MAIITTAAMMPPMSHQLMAGAGVTGGAVGGAGAVGVNAGGVVGGVTGGFTGVVGGAGGVVGGADGGVALTVKAPF